MVTVQAGKRSTASLPFFPRSGMRAQLARTTSTRTTGEGFPLSSSGGEGKGAATSEPRDTHKDDIVKATSGRLTLGAGRPSGSWLMLLLLGSEERGGGE